eukprot:INCI15769.1.p1 GENE.INCI15769.1~~INCI15769.1.p1  ORF type:complete len:1082 (-),score=150.68 INCI15769.1:640-3885(-)
MAAAASATIMQEESSVVWQDLVQRVATNPEKLLDLQRLMTVLVVNGAAELAQLPRVVGDVKIEGSSDLGAKVLDEVEPTGVGAVKLAPPPSLMLQRGGSSRRGKPQTYGRAFEPVVMSRAVVWNHGTECAWVTPLALYPEEVAPFQVYIGTDRQPLDHIASQAEPLCIRPGESIPVEIVAKAPKLTPGMPLKNVLAREWLMFHVSVRSAKAHFDAKTSLTREPWEITACMAGGSGGGSREGSEETAGLPARACASLIGIRAVILWTRSAAQAQTLNKQSKPFVPRRLKNAFSSHPVAFYPLGPIDPVPANLRRMKHIVGVSDHFRRFFGGLTDAGMEHALKKLRTDLVANAAHFGIEARNACEAASEMPRHTSRSFSNSAKGSRSANNLGIGRAAAWEAMHQFSALWNTLLDLEELQMQVDICEYDLHYAALSLPSKDAQVGVLTVPGASEYRPACLFGDIVRVRVPCTQRVNGAAKVAPACYEFQAAIVDRKKSDQVIIVLDTKNLHEICASDHSVVVHVRFNYPSRGVMLMRRALDILLNHERELALSLVLPPAIPRKYICQAHAHQRACTEHRKRWQWFQPGLNEEQRMAVQGLLCDRPADMPHVPFLLTGPAGTGKTVVVVEAVLQALLLGYRVAVCAPSDAAADVLAERLRPFLISWKSPEAWKSPNAWSTRGTKKSMRTPLDFATQHRIRHEGPHGSMLRFNTFSRMPSEVRPAVLSYCCTNSRNLFSIPSLSEKPTCAEAREILRETSVIVATCACISELCGSFVVPDDFGLLVVDEAAQATEPETLCALTSAGRKTKVLLSGDPFQLGPSLRSTAATRLGLDVSLLARLLKRRRYSNPSRKLPKCVCFVDSIRLCKNYRSHEALLRLPSKQFYGNELQALARPESVNYMQQWHELARDEGGVLEDRWRRADPAERETIECAKEDARVAECVHPPCPLVFVGVDGRQDNKVDSPSFFNQAEAVKVCDIVGALVRAQGVDTVTTNSIGVLTSYRMQVALIRRLLRNAGHGAIRVGTVADYQGQEEDIIVVSTVETTKIKTAVLRNGFIGNPGRYNVAITRGKALAIIVGNPNYLV